MISHLKTGKSIQDTDLYCPNNCGAHGTKEIKIGNRLFYCFKCHIGGDIITIICFQKKCSQIEAVKFLIDEYFEEIEKAIFI